MRIHRWDARGVRRLWAGVVCVAVMWPVMAARGQAPAGSGGGSENAAPFRASMDGAPCSGQPAATAKSLPHRGQRIAATAPSVRHAADGMRGATGGTP